MRNTVSTIAFRSLATYREGDIQEAIYMVHISAVDLWGMNMDDQLMQLRNRMFALLQGYIDSVETQYFILILLRTTSLLVLFVLGIIGTTIVWHNRRKKLLFAIIIMLVAVALTSSFAVNSMRQEWRDIYGAHIAQLTAIYDMELSNDIMARYARGHSVLVAQWRYDGYWAEYERDRFGSTIDTFVLLNVPDAESNTLTNIISEIYTMRRIETYAMSLLNTVNASEALSILYGMEYADMRVSAQTLLSTLRDTAAERISGCINSTMQNYGMFVAINIFQNFSLIAITFVFLLMGAKQKERPAHE